MTSFERYREAGGIPLEDAAHGTTGVVPEGVRAADLNRDGLADLVYFVGKQQYDAREQRYDWYGDWRYRLSTGTGFAAEVSLVNTDESSVKADKSPSLHDDNQDGYPDWLWHDWAARQLKVKLWDPAAGGFESTDDTGTTLRWGLDEEEDYYFTLDVDGDSNGDLAYTHEDEFETYLNAAAGRPNLITGISNGLGATTRMQYEPLSTTAQYLRVHRVNTEVTETQRCFSWRGSARYCRPVAHLNIDDFYEALNAPWSGLNQPVTTTAPAPVLVLELIGPLYVVTRVEGSAPVKDDPDATSAIRYVYEQAKLQAAGRGMLGFKSLTTLDEQSGVRTTTTYRQDFPYIGYPVQTEVVDEDGYVLREAVNTWQLYGYQDTWDDTATESGTAALGALQPYLHKSIERTYDLPRDSGVDADGDGETETVAAQLAEVTTVSVVDGYDNPIQITVTTKDLVNDKRFQQVTDNEYGSTLWAQEKGRLSKTTVTTRRDEDDDEDDTWDATAARVAEFTYYTSGTKKGLLQTEVREPDKAAYKHTTTYNYDAHGNRVRAKVTALVDGMTETRCNVDTAVYEPYGRFVAQTRDCLGRATSEVLAWDPWGQPTETERVIATDSNGASTATVTGMRFHTPRGRLYYVWEATGAHSGHTLGACPSTAARAACPVGAAYYTEQRRAGGGRTQTYYDVLARPVRSRTLGLADPAGADWVQADTEYDASGRVARRSEPYYAGETAYWTTYTYDILGRVLDTTLPDHVAGTTDSTVTVSYAGYTTETENAKGQVRVVVRNALARISHRSCYRVSNSLNTVD